MDKRIDDKEIKERSRFVQLLLDILTLAIVAGATYDVFKLTMVKPENQDVNNHDVVVKPVTDNGADESDDTLKEEVEEQDGNEKQDDETALEDEEQIEDEETTDSTDKQSEEMINDSTRGIIIKPID